MACGHVTYYVGSLALLGVWLYLVELGAGGPREGVHAAGQAGEHLGRHLGQEWREGWPLSLLD